MSAPLFGSRWVCVVLQAGVNRNDRVYSPEVLEASVRLFAGAPVHVEHARSAMTPREPAEVVGRVASARFDMFTDRAGRTWPQIVATLEIADVDVQRALLAWRERRRKPLGVSAVLGVESRPLPFAPDDASQFIDRITRVDAVDLTEHPAAGGRVLGVVSGAPHERRAGLTRVCGSARVNRSDPSGVKRYG